MAQVYRPVDDQARTNRMLRSARQTKRDGTSISSRSACLALHAPRFVLRCGTMTRLLFLLLMLIGLWSVVETAHTQPMDDSRATTEQSCSFGMAKGEGSQSCHVPFPTGCLVANVPGTDKPWTTISRGGNTFCRFDEKATNWKTTITGSCSRCKSDHCSVQFIVRFDCSNQVH